MGNSNNLNQPKVSIIIPIYQAENTLKRCVDSVLDQAYQNIEIILVDDGSTDKSGILCDQYVSCDDRIVVIHKENGGVSSARNAGISAVTGKFLMFVDSDDEIAPDYVQTYIDEQELNECDIVIGGFIRVSENGEKSKEIPLTQGKTDLSVWQEICRDTSMFGYIVSKLFRTDIIKANHLKFRTDMYSQEDLDFCLSYYNYCTSFNLISSSQYYYYYVQGKRKPPIWDFISNQLKTYKMASEKVELLSESINAVYERVQLLIYSFFYNVNTKSEMMFAVEKLNNVDGLDCFLSDVGIHDEKSLIVNWYTKRKYDRIYYYFIFRNGIRSVLRKSREE